jgi:hypothetical protein
MTISLKSARAAVRRFDDAGSLAPIRLLPAGYGMVAAIVL